MRRFPSTRFALRAAVVWTACVYGHAYGQLSVQWERLLPVAPSPFATAVSATTDAVYVGGETQGATTWQAFVCKYDSSGNQLWTRQFGSSPYSGNYSFAGASAVSATTDGVYVAGNTMGLLSGQTCAGACDLFLRKYDPSGNELWTRQFGFSGQNSYGAQDSLSGMSAAADGVYVTGYLNTGLPGQAFVPNAFVRKYDFNGNEVWTRQFSLSGTYPTGDTIGYAVSATANGVYIAGSADAWTSERQQVFSDAFVRDYDANGNELWTRQFSGSGGCYSTPSAAAWSVSGASDGVYVAGGTVGALPGQTMTNANGDAFVRKYDFGGNELWTHEFSDLHYANYCLGNGSGASSVSATGIGAFVVWGSGYGSSVSRYDSNGNTLSVSQFPALSQYGPFAVDATTGHVYLIGSTGPGAFVAMLGPGSALPRPASHVSPLPAMETSASFAVQWSGTESGGPGIQDYTIYVSDNGGPFTAWLTHTTATQATFAGVSLHTYGFYSIARDRAGTQEYDKAAAEATTLVDATKPVSHVSALPGTAVSPNFLVQWSGTDTWAPGIRNYNIYISDNSAGYTLWQANVTATQAWYAGYLGHSYAFFSQATDVYGSQETLKSAADTTTQVPAHMAQDVNGDGQINCADLNTVKAALGTKPGQTGWNAAADVNGDGVIDVRDLASVAQKLIPGTTCN